MRPLPHHSASERTRRPRAILKLEPNAARRERGHKHAPTALDGDGFRLADNIPEVTSPGPEHINGSKLCVARATGIPRFADGECVAFQCSLGEKKSSFY